MRIGTLRRDGRSDEFFDGAAADRLMIKRCETCGHWYAPEATGCAECGAGRLGWAQAAGTGTLVTWAVTHGRPAADGTVPPPALLALIELAEGPWLHARLDGVAPDRLREGLAVHAAFEHPAEGESYVIFREGE